MRKSYEEMQKIFDHERLMEYHRWIREIPELQFHQGWRVQIIPPSGGAVVRFRVMFDKAIVSVYLDCYNHLGCMAQPYWEIHPSEDRSCLRFLMNETDELMNAISESIKTQNEIND